MMKVRFLERREVQDQFAGTDKATVFEAGQEYALEDASALRWINRKVAVEAGKSAVSQVVHELKESVVTGETNVPDEGERKGVVRGERSGGFSRPKPQV